MAALTLVAACGPRELPPLVNVAPGVVFRRDADAGIQVLDIDLAAAPVRPVIVADNIERRRNNFIGDAKTVAAWAEQHDALGGMNGGYFGEKYDSVGRRKQIVGLAMVNGKVIAPGGFAVPARAKNVRLLRSALGFTNDGLPDIAWATGTLSGTLRRYDQPVNPTSSSAWPVRAAVACGPRLFVRGRQRITDREERLVSPGRLMRAFVAYDHVEGKPRHLVFGRADAAEYAALADYLTTYFKKTHGTTPHDAMCLDGGPSAQLVYRDNNTLRDAEPTGVLVPTAILLIPKNK